VHHARKNGASASTGLALRGSVDFYAWADVLLVMQRRRDQLLLSIEHRSARSPSPLLLALAGPENAVHLEPATEAELEGHDAANPSTAEDLEAATLAMLADAPEPLRRDEMRARLRVRNATLGDILTRLVERDRIIRHEAGWALP
jgi:hypothetical protein